MYIKGIYILLNQNNKAIKAMETNKEYIIIEPEPHFPVSSFKVKPFLHVLHPSVLTSTTSGSYVVSVSFLSTHSVFLLEMK